MIIEYIENGDVAIYNGYRFRRDKKTGYYLSSRQIGGNRKRLHVYVWENERGEIPLGYHVHHKDEDKGNNDISNFVLLPGGKHAGLHANEYAEANRNKMIKNLQENAIPASKEWHGSKAGHEWHKEHYVKLTEKLHVVKTFVCEYCGKEFTSPQTRTRFCSNSCKAAARRKSGVDDVTKICANCGNEYTANKYQKTKYCPLCKNKKHKRSRQK